MIKPLLAIMSARDIPWIKEKMDKIDYIDKVWFKYTSTDITLKRIVKYFNKHTEYTHIILHSDDGAPDYNHIAMLIADAEKYNFDIVSGCCCMDRMTEDLFLNITFNTVKTELDDKLRREDYHLLPYEFKELNGLIKVWFQGNALSLIRRDVLDKIGFQTWTGRFGADIRFSYECSKKNVAQYVDLRVYMEHYRYPQEIPPFNIKITDIKPKTIVNKATSTIIPKVEATEIIKEIPQYYMDLMDFYYGEAKKLRICIVTEFEQENFFQWYLAFKLFNSRNGRFGNYITISYELNHNFIIDTVIMNRATMELNDKFSSYWYPIRQADIVFVYCARQDENPDWKWYMLPIYTKKYMHKDAKMIVQFDDEFMWLWNKDHIFWKHNVDINIKDEIFFKETKVLDVADAYFTVLSEIPWAKYCTKPIYYMPLPQKNRYYINYESCKYVPVEDKYIAILRHSVNSANTKHIIENVINKLNYPVIYFTTNVISPKTQKEILDTLPPKSKVYSRMNRNAYMKFLSEAYVGIDDNEGYSGWSRFAMECAFSGIPCIGSTVAVNHINPDLYVEHKSYDKINQLIEKMFTDESYYTYSKYFGFLRAIHSLDEMNLCTKFLKIAFIDLKCKYNLFSLDDWLNSELIEFLNKSRSHTIMNRPIKGTSMFDDNTRLITTQEIWDTTYGRFASIVNNPERYLKIKQIIKRGNK